ncbi:hypothetical protein ACFSQD_14285 [Flavihumibacter stibioxidans]|uniref:DUF4834 family protein n=1 Tax=Flavihumibacter stibioxidans TaxID=1834163 RepID=A0ABR7M9N1_9BACT|nr:hypothetical protein [Flavihumibacter stibioxidans]MBC6491229.1 hypothetical protein [Flavihumibacter stibioxidans]
MLKTVLLLLLAYIAYRFIFGFVIPVSRATSQVRRQFRAAQEEMESRMRAQQGAGAQSGTGSQGFNNSSATVNGNPSERPVRKSDYLDFEEVK